MIKYDEKGLITLEYLRHILKYNPDTGLWKWREYRASHVWYGDQAGFLENTGYVRIVIDYERYQAHVLAWFYMTGEWPKNKIDHENTISWDNRWENLREATNSQNGGNRSINWNNTSGFKGVSYYKPNSNWVARIMHDKKPRHLGYFKCPTLAAIAYDKASIKYFGEFARTNFPKENYITI